MDDVATQFLKLLISFFMRIDRSIALRMLRCVPPFETTLTDELLAMLDGDALSREHTRIVRTMSRRMGQLFSINYRAAESIVLPSWDLNMRAFDHSRGFEGRVSKADFGLLIEFGDEDDANYKRCIYIVQAKKLYPDKFVEENPKYSIWSKFSSMDGGQHELLLRFEDRFKLDIYRYMYYMPVRSELDPTWREDEINRARSSSVESGGIWLDRIRADQDSTPRDIYGRHLSETVPFASLVVSHVAEALGATECATFLGGVATNKSLAASDLPRSEDLALALVTGNKQLMADICRKKGLKMPGYPIVPRTVLSLRLPSQPGPRLVPGPPGISGISGI